MTARNILFLAALVLPMSSCVVVTSGETGRRETRIYFGYVHVTEPPTEQARSGVKLHEVETLGIRLDRGIGIGYFHERQESIPLDSRLVIRVQTQV